MIPFASEVSVWPKLPPIRVGANRGHEERGNADMLQINRLKSFSLSGLMSLLDLRRM
jgi:hypothetical protein